MAEKKYKHTYATHTTVIYTVQGLQEAPSSVPQPSPNQKVDSLKCTTFERRHPGGHTAKTMQACCRKRASDGRASHPSHPRARVTRLPPHSRIGRR